MRDAMPTRRFALRSVPGRGRGAGLALSLLLPCLLAGCYIKVNKGKNGEEKDVTVRMPMGGVHVEENTPSAQDIGLPTYPGASLVASQDGGKTADVHLGFGEWQLHLRVAKYQTADPQPKVESFYRSALSRYGDVIECHNGRAVDSPKTTRDGLGCEDQHPGSKGLHVGDDDVTVDLRAGSKRHQHIVGFSEASGGGTQFALLRLDLPAQMEGADKPE